MNFEDLSPIAKKRCKQKGFYFCGSTHKFEDIENIKTYISDFPFYAFIFHNPDDELDKPHIHFLLCIRGTNTIKNIAEMLHCDYGDVQVCKNHMNYARYMLHQGFDDKPDKYNISDVISSDIDRFTSFVSVSHFPISTIDSDFAYYFIYGIYDFKR